MIMIVITYFVLRLANLLSVFYEEPFEIFLKYFLNFIKKI